MHCTGCQGILRQVRRGHLAYPRMVRPDRQVMQHNCSMQHTAYSMQSRQSNMQHAMQHTASCRADRAAQCTAEQHTACHAAHSNYAEQTEQHAACHAAHSSMQFAACHAAQRLGSEQFSSLARLQYSSSQLGCSQQQQSAAWPMTRASAWRLACAEAW